MKIPGLKKLVWLQRNNGQGSFLASTYVYVCQHTHLKSLKGTFRCTQENHDILFSQIIAASSGLALFRGELYAISKWMYKFPTLPTLSKRFSTIGHRRISNYQGSDHMGEAETCHVGRQASITSPAYVNTLSFEKQTHEETTKAH